MSTTQSTRMKKATPPLAPPTLTELRDALPFFKKGTGKCRASWWHVSPTGDYGADFSTGREYARRFQGVLHFNAGPSLLVQFINDMADVGGGEHRATRPLDGIAVGFITEMGVAIQSGMITLSIGRVAIDDAASPLADRFRMRVDSGHSLRGKAAGLTDDPGALRVEDIFAGGGDPPIISSMAAP